MAIRLKRFFLLNLCIFVLSIHAVVFGHASNSFALAGQNVLIVNSYSKGNNWTDAIMNGIDDVLLNVPNLNIYVEYLDVLRLSEEQLNNEYKHILDKYEHISLNAIIATDDAAYDFVASNFSKEVVDSKVVFCGINNFGGKSVYGLPQSSGVFENLEMKKTIDFVLKLHPQASTIAYIIDGYDYSKHIKKQLLQAASLFPEGVKFQEISGDSLDEIGDKLNMLPHDSVVIFLSYFRDGRGNHIPSNVAISFIKNNITVPIYGLIWELVVEGLDGGYVISGYDQGHTAAELALDLLNGKFKDGSKQVHDLPGKYVFNANASAHPDLLLGKLPEDCVILDNKKGRDCFYNTFFWVSIGLTGLSLVLAWVCFWLNSKRRKFYLELAELNRKIHRVLSGSKVAMWSLHVPSGNLKFSDSFRQILNYSHHDMIKTFNEWKKIVHPDDYDRVLEVINEVKNEQKDNYDLEYRIRKQDGTYVWINSKGIADFNEHGEVENLFGTNIECTRRKTAEKGIQSSLREKDMLLKEIHHRVKNNLQIVSSLLNIQSKYVNDPKDADLFTESKLRVRSMSRIHERLYSTGDFSRLDFCSYMATICEDIFSAYLVGPQKITWDVKECDLRLSLDKAVPCGLLINELVTNSVKHAFKGREKGMVSISAVMLDDKNAELVLRDNGVGMPDDFDPKTSDSLGMVLIDNLVQQLEGEYEIKNQGGLQVKVVFPYI